MAKKLKVHEFIAYLHEIPYLSDKEALERFGSPMTDDDDNTTLLDDLHDFQASASRLLISLDVANLKRRFV